MKKIDISSKSFPNTFALVDDCDFKHLIKYNWAAVVSHGNLYALRRKLKSDKGARIQRSISMHCHLIQTRKGFEIDHRDGNGLNNQRSNLRACTHQQNMRNMRRPSNNTSGYKGVSKCPESSTWRAYITVNRRQKHLGCFRLKIEAAHAYDSAARKYYGEFANLNFDKKRK